MEELCRQAAEAGVVGPANLNSPTQIVVSGEDAAVERLVELAPEAGASRAVRLTVGAAFHSQLMKPVQTELELATQTLGWTDPVAPLAANHSGELVDQGEAVRLALVAQIASPVRWVDCVRTLLDAGCTRFVEIGPGRVLTGLVRQIADSEVEAVAADSREKLEAFAAA